MQEGKQPGKKDCSYLCKAIAWVGLEPVCAVQYLSVLETEILIGHSAVSERNPSSTSCDL